MLIPVDIHDKRPDRLLQGIQGRGETTTRVHYITLDGPSTTATSSTAVHTISQPSSTTSPPSSITPSHTSSTTSHSSTSSSSASTGTHTSGRWPWWQIFCLVFALAVTIGIGVFIWWRKKKQQEAAAKEMAQAQALKQQRARDLGRRPDSDEGLGDDSFYEDSLFVPGSDDEEPSERTWSRVDRSRRGGRHESFRDSVFLSYGAMKAAAVKARHAEADKRLQDMLDEETRVETKRQHKLAREEEKLARSRDRGRDKQRAARRKMSSIYSREPQCLV